MTETSFQSGERDDYSDIGNNANGLNSQDTDSDADSKTSDKEELAHVDEAEDDEDNAETAKEEEEDSENEDGSPKRTARALEENWEEAYSKLLQYREKHGNCNVPSRYLDDPHLGTWGKY